MRTSPVVCGLAAAALAVLASGCGDSGPAPTGEKITLKLNLKAGDQRKATADMDMKMTMSAGDKQQQMNVFMGLTMSFDVLDVDQAGVHTLKTTYDRVRVKMSGGGVGIEYDSDTSAGEENPATQVFAAMVGASLTVKVTPEGKTLEVTGLDELAEKVSAKLPPFARANVDQQVKGMTNSLDQMMAFLPQKPVDIRDSWSSTMELATDPSMPMKVDATYTLHDRKDGVAIVKIDGKMRAGEGLSGTMTGTMKIDEATGWNQGGEMTMDMSGTMQDMEVQMKGEFTFGS